MLKKTIRRLGALAMVLAMAVSVFAVNASAVDAEVVTNAEKTVTITKEVTKKANVLSPTETFTFKVEAGTTAPAANGMPATVAGDPNDIEIVGTTVEANAGKTTVTGETQLKIKKNVYEAPGVYSYVIKENAGTLDGMHYDTTAYSVLVYVDNKYDVTVLVYKGTNLTAKNKTSNIKFTNDYASNVPDGGTWDLKVSKEIKGKFTTGSETFKFDIKVGTATDKPTGTTLAGTYNVIVYDKDGKQKGDATTITLDSTSATTVELGNGEYVKVYGLTKYNTYTVKEQEHGADGFVTSVEASNAALNNQTNVVTRNSDIIADQTVAYTNTKDATIPGGVIMTIAPYALMLVLAGAFAVVFLSRRNRAE